MGPQLSVVVTVTSGGVHVDRCLEALAQQRDAPPFEVLVPVEDSHPEAAGWRAAHPGVRFPSVPEPEGGGARDPGAAHLQYDRRRAAGLAAARADVVALTEDHARPAPDWCARVVQAHRRPCAVIGGAVDNGVDRPLHWAVYFCDFARYQSPLPEGPSRHVSDVNVSYKREALLAAPELWRDAYHETALHAGLARRGESLWLDPALVVRQERGVLHPLAALRERCAWGRLYAGKRVREIAPTRRLAIALGAPLLPLLLLARAVRVTWRRGRNRRALARALPWMAPLLVAWSAGEWIGTVTGRPTRGRARR